jgi:hypothetical protein
MVVGRFMCIVGDSVKRAAQDTARNAIVQPRLCRGHYLQRNRFATPRRRCCAHDADRCTDRLTDSGTAGAGHFSHSGSITMTHVHPSRPLRAALLIDAAASGALGLLQTAASAYTSALLGLPTALVLGTGVFMLAYAASLGVMARSTSLPRPAAQIVIVGNAGWALGCAVLAAVHPQLTVLGVGYLLLQAVAVAAFAGLQAAGLARSNGATLTAPQRA